MNYKSIKQHEKFDENPFLEKAIKDISIVKKTQTMRTGNRDEIQMIVAADGTVEGYSAFMRFIEVDEERFTKLYLSQFESFWDLSKPSIRVFGYIMSVLKKDQDSIMIRMDKCLEFTKYKQRAMIISGLSGLVESGIIAKSKYENEYFINPLIVFNGSRVTFAKTYVKKRSNEKIENQLPLFNSYEEV